MTALRNRLVTEQDGQQHVSATLLTPDEIGRMLALEAWIHEGTGWTVNRYGSMLRFEKGETIRWMWVRSRHPLEDTI